MSDPTDLEALARRVRDATALLEAFAADRSALLALPEEVRVPLLKAAGQVANPDAALRRTLSSEARRQRKAARAERIQETEQQLEETGIRRLRRQSVFTTPNYPPPAADEPDVGPIDPQFCYVCKRSYTDLHPFYDRLCPECGAFNFRKRTELADLRGRVALLTGGRVKIGYQAGLKLLRSGARLIVTTRFPRDSATRYAAEPDAAEWLDRLEIYGLDLRHTPSVDAFCAHVGARYERLDFIVNNACQTVRRPPGFYRHMMDKELASASTMPERERALLGPYEGVRGYSLLPEAASSVAPGLTHAAALSQIALLDEDRAHQGDLFPEGRLDADLQQVDLRDRNSWRLVMHEVSSVELLEVHLVNAVAPFLLNARLKPLMLRSGARDLHIVNVSAVEGQFYRKFKTTRHPHTNMAKAALNMMTRTAAADYAHDGIHMNAVDTGWVTDEDPQPIAQRKTENHRFHPPLDIVDGAARILDPIIDGFNTGVHRWGLFLKDYRPTDW